jgi:hypothetical protein
MSKKCLTDPQCACKPVHPDRAAGSGRPQGPLARFATLAGGGPVLITTAQFGRSPVRDAAYRLRDRRPDLDLMLSWRLFAGLGDWGKRWPAEQSTFAAGLILSAADDPAVDRAVSRCLADLARLGRPLLWGSIGSQRVRWQPRFMLTPNGWPPEQILPYPAAYARLGVAHDAPEFCPLFDPILCSVEPDYSVSDSGLHWWDARHFHWVTRDGKRTLYIGCMPDE